MDLSLYINQIILTYKSSIRIRIVFASLLVILGTLIIIFNTLNILEFSTQIKSLVSVSGTLVSSVCAFPIKEIVDRKNKIKLIELLMIQCQNSSNMDKKKIEELIWKFVEKNTID